MVKQLGESSLDREKVEAQDGEGTERNIRSERKRIREKQRRYDLSNAFDELATFVVQVDPEPGDAALLEGKKKRKKSGEDSSGLTRLDLIDRALKLMKRLHKENEERKRIVMSMEGRGGQHGPRNDDIAMTRLVPACARLDDEAYPVARATYPCYPPVPPSRSYYYENDSTIPHDARDYGMDVQRRDAPQYHSANWGHRYGGHPPTHYHHSSTHYHHPPPPMGILPQQQAQHDDYHPGFHAPTDAFEEML